MAEQSNIHRFFNSVNQHYTNDASAAIERLLDDKKLTDTKNPELNFILFFIAKLHLDFNKEVNETKKLLEEMLQGGYLKLQDNGSFYQELITNFNSHLEKQISSHQSIAQQYSFSGLVLQQVLIGVTVNDKGNKTTWVQFERHSTKSIIQLLLHLIDYLRYKLTGKNIGPFGSSVHTEYNPLDLYKGSLNSIKTP